MHINVQTFDALTRRRGVNQAELARKAKLGLKTIGRIKLGKDLRPSNVEKIAAALETDVQTLLSPPSDALLSGAEQRGDLQRLVVDIDAPTLNNLWLAAQFYRVPVRSLIQYAPLLFSIVAEASLNARRKRIASWRASVEGAMKELPLPHEAERRQIMDGVIDVYEAEMSAIDARDLNGGVSDPFTTDPGLRTEAECAEGHPFLEFLEDLARQHGQDLSFFGSETTNIVYDHRGSDAAKSMGLRAALDTLVPEDLPGSDEALRAIGLGDVLVRDIPENLMAADMAEERVLWIASAASVNESEGGDDE
ncbi:MAG: helix-turn-helix transcriptional regulator [Rhodobacteraceae bacterium]|nr:helix-turn-helix transcriptional regulator [Paracoccaceae bacterium]